MDSKVYIILLNYNNWADTIECLETILRSDYKNYQIIVVDNNSENNSTDYIRSWLDGKLDIWVNPKNKLRELSFPPLKKPIKYVFYTENQINQLYKNKEKLNKILNKNGESPVILIQSNKNRGYSAGNNIGIKYALSKDDFEYIWLLNNDIVIEENSLSNLISCANKLNKKTSPIGTLLLYYDYPEKVQALGAKFNKFYALGTHLHVFEKVEDALKKFDIKKIDYVIGASMLLRKNFIEEVGLLSEDYFIYFEEIDIAERGKKYGYKPEICTNSIVYHKEAVTIDSFKSDFSDFFAMRNRKIFVKKYYPYLLPVLYLSYFISIIKRIRRKEFKKALNIIKIMFGKQKYEK